MDNPVKQLATRIKNKPALYVMECDGKFKVGFSKDPESRLSGIQTGNPNPVYIRKVFWVSNAKRTEKEVHSKLASFRVRGEWFDCPIERVIAAISKADENHHEINQKKKTKQKNKCPVTRRDKTFYDVKRRTKKGDIEIIESRVMGYGDAHKLAKKNKGFVKKAASQPLTNPAHQKPRQSLIPAINTMRNKHSMSFSEISKFFIKKGEGNFRPEDLEALLRG